MAENLTRADRVNRNLEKLYAAPLGSNRKERRVLERAQKQQGKHVVTMVQDLEPLDPLLEESDLLLCQRELKDYKIAQEQTRISLMRHGIYLAAGIPESSVRTFYANLAKGNVVEGGEIGLWRQADPRKYQQTKQRRQMFDAHNRAFAKRIGNKIVVDEDANEMVALIKDEIIPLKDIYEEVLRSRGEKIELVELQIEWLEGQQEAKELLPTQPVGQPVQIAEQSLESAESLPLEVKTVRSEYPFLGWRLFWTRNHWSSDDNHLIPISTNSREDTLKSLTDVARGEISIKPISVLRALEFYLQKDVIQKALATRNKYGPEGIRDWAKIKRGRDRIFFLIPQADKHQAIFFAAGRDVVYRGV